MWHTQADWIRWAVAVAWAAARSSLVLLVEHFASLTVSLSFVQH